jgi:hypothetical protein
MAYQDQKGMFLLGLEYKVFHLADITMGLVMGNIHYYKLINLGKDNP